MAGQIINAVTKNRQDEDTVLRMTERATGHMPKDFICRELAGGLCNAVYLVQADGRKLVLKIASPQNVVTMRHEKYYIQTEAEMLKLFGEKINIPAPELVCFDNSGEICHEPYFFMSFIEGKPLDTFSEYPSAREIYGIKSRLGEICRQISSVESTHFGIPNLPDTYSHSNCDFMLKMFHMLLLDADDRKIEIPGIRGRELLSLIGQCRPQLDEVKKPVYVHTDTWNGNLMIQDGKLSGLIDYAAVLYGDVLLNHDFHDFGERPEKAFCEGFGKMEFTDNEWIRILVYRIWHRLGMIVERGFREYDDPDTYSWVLGEYVKEADNLKKCLSS